MPSSFFALICSPSSASLYLLKKNSSPLLQYWDIPLPSYSHQSWVHHFLQQNIPKTIAPITHSLILIPPRPAYFNYPIPTPPIQFKNLKHLTHHFLKKKFGPNVLSSLTIDASPLIHHTTSYLPILATLYHKDWLSPILTSLENHHIFTHTIASPLGFYFKYINPTSTSCLIAEPNTIEFASISPSNFSIKTLPISPSSPLESTLKNISPSPLTPISLPSFPTHLHFTKKYTLLPSKSKYTLGFLHQHFKKLAASLLLLSLSSISTSLLLHQKSSHYNNLIQSLQQSIQSQLSQQLQSSQQLQALLSLQQDYLSLQSLRKQGTPFSQFLSQLNKFIKKLPQGQITSIQLDSKNVSQNNPTIILIQGSYLPKKLDVTFFSQQIQRVFQNQSIFKIDNFFLNEDNSPVVDFHLKIAFTKNI